LRVESRRLTFTAVNFKVIQIEVVWSERNQLKNFYGGSNYAVSKHEFQVHVFIINFPNAAQSEQEGICTRRLGNCSLSRAGSGVDTKLLFVIVIIVVIILLIILLIILFIITIVVFTIFLEIIWFVVIILKFFRSEIGIWIKTTIVQLTYVLIQLLFNRIRLIVIIIAVWFGFKNIAFISFNSFIYRTFRAVFANVSIFKKAWAFSHSERNLRKG
jgi:hypothetical protein